MKKIWCQLDMREAEPQDGQRCYVLDRTRYYVDGKEVTWKEFNAALDEPHEVTVEAKPPVEGKPDGDAA